MKKSRIAASASALCLLVLLVTMVGAVAADGEEEEEKITGPMLHGISVGIGCLAIVIMITAIRGIGGKLGSGFKVLTLGIVLITLGFAAYMIYELRHIEAVDLVGEAFLIAGILVIAFGTKKFMELAK